MIVGKERRGEQATLSGGRLASVAKCKQAGEEINSTFGAEELRGYIWRCSAVVETRAVCFYRKRQLIQLKSLDKS